MKIWSRETLESGLNVILVLQRVVCGVRGYCQGRIDGFDVIKFAPYKDLQMIGWGK